MNVIKVHLEQPLLTIIVAVFNGAKTLQRCIDSVVCQSYEKIELIIIDGGSTDGTVEILQSCTKNIAHWVTEPDTGIYSAWNKGLDHATGDWICFLGADDYFWGPNVLEIMARSLARVTSDIRVVYAKVALVSVTGNVLSEVGFPWETSGKLVKEIMSIPHPGLMHHRTLFEKHGRFDESFRIAGDYELLLRELRSGAAVFVSDLIVAGMQYGGVSSNPKNSIAIYWEIRKAQIKHGLYIPGRHWLTSVIKAYSRSLLWAIFGEHRARHIVDWGRRITGKRPFWTRI